MVLEAAKRTVGRSQFSPEDASWFGRMQLYADRRDLAAFTNVGFVTTLSPLERQTRFVNKSGNHFGVDRV
jgi:hypothetical protein